MRRFRVLLVFDLLAELVQGIDLAMEQSQVSSLVYYCCL